MYEQKCEHLEEGPPPEPGSIGCEECMEISQAWVQLRICRSCGHVGCCDSSIGKHATAHYQATGHPVMQSFEPGDTWGWCYVEEKMLGPLPPARK